MIKIIALCFGLMLIVRLSKLAYNSFKGVNVRVFLFLIKVMFTISYRIVGLLIKSRAPFFVILLVFGFCVAHRIQKPSVKHYTIISILKMLKRQKS